MTFFEHRENGLVVIATRVCVQVTITRDGNVTTYEPGDWFVFAPREEQDPVIGFVQDSVFRQMYAPTSRSIDSNIWNPSSANLPERTRSIQL